VRHEFGSSFDRMVREMDGARRTRVVHAVEELSDFFEGGARPADLGLKQLRDPFWEIRPSRADRVVFALWEDRLVFLAAGDHEEIRRLLRSV
jgi:hypothetical protein